MLGHRSSCVVAMLGHSNQMSVCRRSNSLYIAIDALIEIRNSCSIGSNDSASLL